MFTGFGFIVPSAQLTNSATTPYLLLDEYSKLNTRFPFGEINILLIRVNVTVVSAVILCQLF